MISTGSVSTKLQGALYWLYTNKRMPHHATVISVCPLAFIVFVEHRQFGVLKCLRQLYGIIQMKYASLLENVLLEDRERDGGIQDVS